MSNNAGLVAMALVALWILIGALVALIAFAADEIFDSDSGLWLKIFKGAVAWSFAGVALFLVLILIFFFVTLFNLV